MVSSQWERVRRTESAQTERDGIGLVCLFAFSLASKVTTRRRTSEEWGCSGFTIWYDRPFVLTLPSTRWAVPVQCAATGDAGGAASADQCGRAHARGERRRSAPVSPFVRTTSPFCTGWPRRLLCSTAVSTYPHSRFTVAALHATSGFQSVRRALATRSHALSRSFCREVCTISVPLVRCRGPTLSGTSHSHLLGSASPSCWSKPCDFQSVERALYSSSACPAPSLHRCRTHVPRRAPVWRTESIWDLSVSAATSPAANADHTSDLVSGQRTRALRVRAVRRMCAFVSTIVSELDSTCARRVRRIAQLLRPSGIRRL